MQSTDTGRLGNKEVSEGGNNKIFLTDNEQQCSVTFQIHLLKPTLFPISINWHACLLANFAVHSIYVASIRLNQAKKNMRQVTVNMRCVGLLRIHKVETG